MKRAALTDAAAGNGGATGTQTITRTLAVLDLLRDSRHDLGISDIAQRLSLSGSTVHRIVRALVESNYLAQNHETERYYLGRAAVLLGQAANDRLGLQRAQVVLDRLRDETGESVNLGARDRDDMVILIRAESPHPLRFSQEPGSRLPVYATSMGKAWLSHCEVTIEEGVDSIETLLRPLTSKTISSKADLLHDLRKIRKRGYSIDDEEAVPGVRCIAAPVLSLEGSLLAAVAIQSPAVRMPRKRLATLAPIIRAAAEEVSQLLPVTQRL